MKFTVEFIDIIDEHKNLILIPTVVISWEKCDKAIYFGWLFGVVRIGGLI